MSVDTKVKSFKDLEIWKRSVELAERVYVVTGSFPKEEVYGLTSKVKRSAISIPSNIAEGFARQSKNEYRQFLFVALGSGAELTTQLLISSKLGFLGKPKADILIDEIEQISKMTMSLIKKLN